MKEINEEIQIKLSKEEALVLFEFLSRFSNEETLKIVDQSEAHVLWDILCNLEKVLIEPFSNKYIEILEEARKKVLS
jgi:hypothetical protein